MASKISKFYLALLIHSQTIIQRMTVRVITIC